ncbi:hypothetical protein A3D62_01585 [Candidatus Kaiserbacteria bacterium RIFCSPHIGHO2_02_FULL_49_11]|uniref:Aryl sulfotransferase n=1 Tax=Candidatus Kaiserbacteria bacterium RIFCSPHIGHO2_02_FULL_49_11 TaxID=1798489 RepID=A0A1F6D1J1_9BACT|nr:MAG: hypothetical protein A3D62_01585 [Candidatus Kaiserbacteria bacterium RIFCSPHIGHO2_02_FULL_49_11]
MKALILKWFFIFSEKLGLFDLFEKYYFNTARTGRSKMGTLPVLDREKVDESYLLISPFNTGDYKELGGSIYLTDLYGVLLHKWKTKYQSSIAHLMKDRTVYVSQVLPNSNDTAHFPGGGRTGVIEKLNWEGKVLWEYRNPGIHHDFEVLPNGNLILVRWEEVTGALKKEVVSQVAGKDEHDPFWSDVIFEITPDGSVVWEWHAKDHLDPSIDSFGPFPYRVEWTHANAIRYLQKNPITGREAFLMSMRNTGRILIVEKESGKILWRSPEGMFLGQHDPTMLENGNVLAFDNALHRRPTSRSEVVSSRVIEIDPRTNNVAGMLEGGRTSSEKARLYSSIMCGAQRLKNGNTHITISSPGHLFEVTPEKELVWDCINPHVTHGVDLWPNNSIFTSWRYHKDDIDWPPNFPSPLPATPAYAQVAQQAIFDESYIEK